MAIVSSLFIVGAIVAFGAARAWQAGLTENSVLLLFGLSAVAGALFGSGVGAWIGSQWQLLIFALLALVAAWRMLSGLQQVHAALSRSWLLLAGLVSGFFTGLVGVGGGFLIVPALVLVAGLPMRRATATSLVLIAVSAFSGFAGYWFMWPEPGGPPVPWLIVTGVTVAGILGMLGAVSVPTPAGCFIATYICRCAGCAGGLSARPRGRGLSEESSDEKLFRLCGAGACRH